jgi:hypothetical protein
MTNVDTAATIAAAMEAEERAIELYKSIDGDADPHAKAAAVTLVTYTQRTREAAEEAYEASQVLDSLLPAKVRNWTEIATRAAITAYT